MAVRVAINGFGRIGRNVLRAVYEAKRNDIEVVAINDLGPVETNAHLLRYDSVHGRFPGTVTVDGDSIDIGSGRIKVTAVRDPNTLPWKDLGIDIVFDNNDFLTTQHKAAQEPDSYDIYDQCFHNLDIVWFWRAIQAIDLRRIARWSEVSRSEELV